MPEFRRPGKQDWIKVVGVVAVAVGAIVFVVSWFSAHGRMAPVAAALCVAGVLVVLVNWHASKTGYCCAHKKLRKKLTQVAPN